MLKMIRYTAVALILFMSHAAEAKRVALVIANSRYQSVAALPNPAADARLIAASLRRAGFDSVELQLDLSKTALEGQLRGVRTARRWCRCRADLLCGARD